MNPEKIDNIFRLGKIKSSDNEQTSEKTNPRPLLIKFNSLEYKKDVLKYCKFLYCINDGVKININHSQDLTIKERKERRELVNELKRRKQENNETDLAIRNGKIVTLIKPFHGEAQPSVRKSWAELFK